jgi:cytochrome o ubiquinol oxidase subunit 1
MLWFLGFIGTFTVGGLTGVLLAIPPVDFQLHNSLFLVAHFHTMVIGGVLFGIFAGITYWFPKMSGIRLNERIGRYAFWSWIIGFIVAFAPLYVLGLMGATRRLDRYDSATGWQPFYIMALIGGIIICVGVVLQVVQIIASLIQKRKLRDATGDPWDGRTLEWSTPSPPQFYNFIVIPKVKTRDAYWGMKHLHMPGHTYKDILMPKNTATGIYISVFAFLAGFGFVWNIVWLIIASILGVIVCLIVRTFDENTEYTLSAAEVEKLEDGRKKKDQLADAGGDADTGEDMGLREFVIVVVKWIRDGVRSGRWRTR